jgi:hypothetical protein
MLMWPQAAERTEVWGSSVLVVMAAVGDRMARKCVCTRVPVSASNTDPPSDFCGW